MKKFLVLMLSAACALCLAFGITACGGGNGGTGDVQQNETGDQGGGSEDSGDQGSEESRGHQHKLEENQVVCKTCGEQLAESLDFELNTNTYRLTSGVPTSDGKIIIPSVYNGLPVTSIGANAFYNCTSLTEISIPNSVTSIAGSAFYNCTNIKTATMPTIAINYILQDNLQTLIIAGGDSIKRQAFENCISLESVTISDSVTSIGEYAFRGCTNIQTATIPTIAIRYIPKDSLHTVILTSGDSIDNSAFSGYANIISITIPDSVIYIGESAFRSCTRLESITVTDGNPAFASQDGILYNKGKTELIEVPQTKTMVNIPDGVTSIGKNAFMDCTSLTSITIPDSVTSIGNAFFGCTSLTSITVAEKNTAYSSQDGILYNKDKTELIKVPQTKTKVTIPDNVTFFGEWAFDGCKSLTSINIPDGVTSIGGGAFYGCTAEIKWGNNHSIKEINCFNGYKGTSITIPDGVTSIGSRAFSECTNLESITIPNSVTSIGDMAFYHCTNLESVYITDIKAWCNIDFVNSTSNPLCDAHNLYLNDELVTEITADMLQGVTEIKRYAFCFCSNLTSITIPDSVIYIGGSAFRGCYFKSVYFTNPDGWYCAEGPYATSSVDIPSEDLQDPKTAAQYLKFNYTDYYWRRKTA